MHIAPCSFCDLQLSDTPKEDKVYRDEAINNSCIIFKIILILSYFRTDTIDALVYML